MISVCHSKTVFFGNWIYCLEQVSVLMYYFLFSEVINSKGKNGWTDIEGHKRDWIWENEETVINRVLNFVCEGPKIVPWKSVLNCECTRNSDTFKLIQISFEMDRETERRGKKHLKRNEIYASHKSKEKMSDTKVLWNLSSGEVHLILRATLSDRKFIQFKKKNFLLYFVTYSRLQQSWLIKVKTMQLLRKVCYTLTIWLQL
jgi:hypothetical protein